MIGQPGLLVFSVVSVVDLHRLLVLDANFSVKSIDQVGLVAGGSSLFMRLNPLGDADSF